MSLCINKATILGHCGKDPESKSGDNFYMAKFSVATNRKTKSLSGEVENLTEWFNVVCFGKLAEICSQIIKKGDKVYVEGRIESYKLVGKDGKEFNGFQIIASEVISLSKNSSMQNIEENKNLQTNKYKDYTSDDYKDKTNNPYQTESFGDNGSYLSPTVKGRYRGPEDIKSWPMLSSKNNSPLVNEKPFFDDEILF